MAANTRDIRRRIKSVKNTSQITKAMQMVAAAKMRKAQTAALAGRPYAEILSRVLHSVSGCREEAGHELLEARDGGRHLVIVISTDKGLCGALNTNLLREVAKFDPKETSFVVVGRKAQQWLLRNQREVLADFQIKEGTSFLEVKSISKFAIQKFTGGEFSRVSVVFTDFVNTLTQVPKEKTILPVGSLAVSAGLSGNVEERDIQNPVDSLDYQFEPNAGAVLDAILPHYVHFQLFQMLLDARASEHSARMVAMKNATDNAKQLIKDLTLEYNKIRQASITTELLEITTAQMALG